MKSPATHKMIPPVQPGQQVLVFGSLSTVISASREEGTEGRGYWFLVLRDSVGEFGCDYECVERRIA